MQAALRRPDDDRPRPQQPAERARNHRQGRLRHRPHLLSGTDHRRKLLQRHHAPRLPVRQPLRRRPCRSRLHPRQSANGRSRKHHPRTAATSQGSRLSVFRDNEPIKPVAETRLFVGDDVYVLVANDALNTLIPYLAGQATENRRILIGGGGNIGQRVAVALEKNHDIKIIETSRDRCRDLSQILDNTLILKGTASDEKLLSEEGVAETDIFCALTNDDEENILSAMLARELGCKQTAVLINRAAYVDILERNLGIVLSPSQITIGSVLTHVRTGDISAVHSLRQGSAEAIEAVIHGDDDTSPVVGREIQGIEWPDNAMPGAIVRDGEVLIAHDDTVIMSDDRLICFISDRKAVREVERLLQVSVNYF